MYALTERHAVTYRNTKYLCKELGLDILIGLCKDGFSCRGSALEDKDGIAMKVCTKCGDTIAEFCEFPGMMCLDCYSVSPEGTRMVTAEELTRMWGGKA